MFLQLKSSFLPALFLALLISSAHAQTLTQTVKGTVWDKLIKQPLPGATVVMLDQQNTTLGGAVTDMDGRFRIAKVPVGTQKLKVTFLGYKEISMANVLVISGKELELNLEMEENLVMANEAVVVGERQKQKPLNELSAASTRTFSVEESQRYAAAANDPGRMASAFAGVGIANDGNNTISIRGNAPNSMIWRLEGVDIPNPNHFSQAATSGGGISILSGQVLSNSDFSTGAFAAEYGNALSGIFDLRFRKGNTDRREYTAQVGVLGLDMAAEGPLALGSQRGSYLVNYRYSTLGVLAAAGLDFGGSVTNFQDLSFNIFLPTARAGVFTLFGIGGNSYQTYGGKLDSVVWRDDQFQRYNGRFEANTGVVGLTHQLVRGSKWHLKTVLAASGTQNVDNTNEFQADYSNRTVTRIRNEQSKLTLSSVLSYKPNARHFVRVGTYGSLLNYQVGQAFWVNNEQALVNQVVGDGSTKTIDAFGQWQYRATERLTASMGVHALALALNNTYQVEPRASLRYRVDKKSNLNLGYGHHSQTHALGVYFAQNDANQLINKDLGMNKAYHLVLGYDRSLTKNTHVKVEVYHQWLYNIGVRADSATSYSILNQTENFPDIPLKNTGLGRNYGLELTLERFLQNGFYYLVSSSWFDSEYRASDLRWRNTFFNTDMVNNVVLGKEWNWNRRHKNRTIGVNLKFTQMGRARRTPLDLDASIVAGEGVYDQEQAYTDRLPMYYRLDTGVRIKRNYKNATTTLGIDLQNATNRKNIFFKVYNPSTQMEREIPNLPLLPLLSYKVEW
jgi:hypothetical protein